MTDQVFEQIDGVTGPVATRVVEYGGILCLEAEPQDPRYVHGRFEAPPILRIPLAENTPEEVEKAKAAVPEGLQELFGA